MLDGEKYCCCFPINVRLVYFIFYKSWGATNHMARWCWFRTEERMKSSPAWFVEQKRKKPSKRRKKPHKDSNVKRVQMRLRADAPSHRIGAGLWSIWAEVTFSRRPRWEERPPHRGLAFRGRHLFMWIHRLCPQRPAQYTARPTAAPLKLQPYWAWRHPPTPPPPFKRAPVELQSAPPSLCKSRPTVLRRRPDVFCAFKLRYVRGLQFFLACLQRQLFHVLALFTRLLTQNVNQQQHLTYWNLFLLFFSSTYPLILKSLDS